jgi:hypothetical protein
MSLKTITIFQYLDNLDCFVVSDGYRRIADQLGLTEWSPVVWIGRLFTLDNDYGEHWFDNWHLREPLDLEAARRGLTEEELLIIDPERFQNGTDGPCHSPAFRKRFWTDVLRSLELSYDLLAEEARACNQERLRYLPQEYIPDLEDRITALERELFGGSSPVPE